MLCIFNIYKLLNYKKSSFRINKECHELLDSGQTGIEIFYKKSIKLEYILAQIFFIILS